MTISRHVKYHIKLWKPRSRKENGKFPEKIVHTLPTITSEVDNYKDKNQ